MSGICGGGHSPLRESDPGSPDELLKRHKSKLPSSDAWLASWLKYRPRSLPCISNDFVFAIYPPRAIFEDVVGFGFELALSKRTRWLQTIHDILHFSS